MRFFTFGLLALLAAATTAAAFDEAAIPDTKENRMEQAARVLMGTPIEETLEGIVQEAIRVKGQDVADVRTFACGAALGIEFVSVRVMDDA